MKISYNWLKQFIKTDWDAEKTGELLTDLGLEVEGIEKFESVKGGLKGVVIGKVLTCEQHPNADRLKVTTVNVGQEKPLQIVCGAPNVDAGQTVPVATIGTVLYDDKGESFTIKKGKIRGVESFGMICAEDELGLGKSHDGIMVLEDKWEAGTPVAKIFDIETDEVFEIGLTPNRADAMSHLGVARDLRAGLLQKEIDIEFISPSVSAFHISKRTLKMEVSVEDKEKAPRYSGVTISGVTVEESPKWLQNRLKSIGLTPINNVVDVTNYVLHGLGQPLHAFDANKIKGNKVVVKTVEKGTKFTTLDNVERELYEDDLMICDGNGTPMCIAGVLGGINSGVTENTTNIFLESAYFNPVAVRKTAKRHGLNTDASFRFERGIDPNKTEYALKIASILIVEIAGGEISSEIVDIYPKKIEDFQVFLSFEKLNKLIGEELPKEVIKSILSSLEIKIASVTDRGLGLIVPTYRVDVLREADLIEEILRVYGYNNIKIPEKLNTSVSYSEFDATKVENVVANHLVSLGFNEIMSNSLTKADYIKMTEKVKEEHNVAMLNPLSSDLGVMRQSMLFSGLESVVYNNNRKNTSLSFFEFGKTYHKFQEYEEQKHLSLFVTGNREQERWNTTQRPSDFFYIKGVVEAILLRLGIKNTKMSPVKNDVFSEGVQLSLGKTKLVEIGVVKKAILKGMGCKQQVLFTDFHWDNLLSVLGTSNFKVEELPKYPSVKRDLALLIDEKVAFSEIYQLAYQTERKLLKEVELFDVYEGDKLEKGKKSYAVSFILQDDNKTLKDKQIDKVMTKLQATFEKNLGAVLRS
ncbi:MAG: phenylalanine--tRNA ligase subunit beta [Flavobacteriaceae bacterium]|nr:phenylalanine--tRNA ligase subunit beta [Flavobacteriaceae bacterium]